MLGRKVSCSFLTGSKCVIYAKSLQESRAIQDGRLASLATCFPLGRCEARNKFLLGSNYSLLGTKISFRGNKHSFRGANESLLGANVVCIDNCESLRGSKEFSSALGIEMVFRDSRERQFRGRVSQNTNKYELTNASASGPNAFEKIIPQLQTILNEAELMPQTNSDMCLSVVPDNDIDKKYCLSNPAIDHCDSNFYSDTTSGKHSKTHSTRIFARNSRSLSKSRLTHRLHLRDREPSRLSLKRVLHSLKSKTLRKRYKKQIKKSVPLSSVLVKIAMCFKHWKLRYTARQDSFYSKYFQKQKLSLVRFNLAERTNLLSGDVERNPGPNAKNSPDICSVVSPSLFENRLKRHGLTALEVGGGGNCLFRAIAHQLYNDPNRQLEIRTTGVQYLQNNPERFIESAVIDNMSWLEYITRMSRDGTWGDHIIMQSIAEAMNLSINVVESSSNFTELTVVEPVNRSPESRTVYIGHIGEMHYVSTKPLCFGNVEAVSNNRKRKLDDSNKNQSHFSYLKTMSSSYTYNDSDKCSDDKANNGTPEGLSSEITISNFANRNQYQNAYRRKMSSPEQKAKRNACQKDYRRNISSPEQKAKRNARQKDYKQKVASSEQKAKRNAHQTDYRRKISSPEQKAKQNAWQKSYRQKVASSEQKAKRNAQQKAWRLKNLARASSDLAISKFHKTVAQGPIYVCSCCDQLWYRHSVISTATLRDSNHDSIKYLSGKTSVNNVEWICKTCHSHLIKNKIPPCAVVNGMVFPEKPSFFDLNELECRLLAPRIAFQKLMQAPRGKQLKIHGNIVNVPADVSTTINQLPRLPSNTGTIKVNLKRKLKYKSSALSLNVRPHKVLQAAHWLIKNSSLYQDQGIELNSLWESEFERQQTQNTDSGSEQQPAPLTSDIDDTTSCVNDGDEENWSEDEAETPAGVIDTMLTASDFLEDNERQHIFNVAPAEGNIHLSVFRDRHSEELAYPGIFLGQPRPESKFVHYSDICKSELRRSDRRAAMCVENIFFKAKKLQMKILLGKSNIALRKCKGNNRNLSARHLKQEGAIDRLMRFDEGFKFLKALRGSPPYFEKAKKDLFAMIRQLGPATLFCSFSSAETQWYHLLRILGELIDNKTYSDNELENLNWEERCRLIQSDPVTCARHFDYQVNQFLGSFLLSSLEPLGKISDWFYRVEYQQRGSHHIHMVIWVPGAPEYQVQSDTEVTAFIDKIITCHKPTNNPQLLDLVNRQVHRHSHTCHKNTEAECRFNYPQPPMRKTSILQPLDTDIPESEIKAHKATWKLIKKHLDDMKEGEDISFDQLLSDLKVTEENYVLAIRSSLNASTVFLERTPVELRINNYNPDCLRAWRADMDIQFVLDVYACAVYIVNYISKGQKGMSDLLREACSEVRKGYSSIKQQVRDIGSKFVNNVEISAQEAVYITLQLPMRKSSRQIIFINTAPPEERVELLKPLSDIKEMDDDCEEIYTGGLLKRYCKRPAKLEHLTLADWAAWYDSTGKPYVKPTHEKDADGFQSERFVDHFQNDDDEFHDKCEKKSTKKRTKARIIRSVWFNKEAEPEKHFRELLMLFTPWRNEETDLLGSFPSYELQYKALAKMIDKQMKQYAVCNEDFTEIEHNIDTVEESFYSIAPCTQNIEQQDTAEGNQDLHPDFNETYNLSDDLGIPSCAATEPLILNEMPDDEYRNMVKMLNKEQKEFFYHALHLTKTSDEPFYCFLSGGAGVGKSHVTKALYQAALKYYNRIAGDSFTEIRVLMLAPTGKAAYNIKGNTIHSALAIPACQSLKTYKRLDSSRLNSLRCQLGGVKLIFIDEISMVGNTMFNIQIDNRLKDIKGSSLPFGGVSIIAIGDLFQLQPVMDNYIFKDMDNLGYGILAPNIWQELFKMYELHEIMRQRESKQFAEMLNRLREGKQTEDDIIAFKERILKSHSEHYPMDAPHLFIQNAKANDFNERAHNSIRGAKFTIKAHDSVIGAESHELRDKILNQIPSDPRKTKQLHSTLNLAVSERTEISLNIRTDDGMTNGASNVVKLIQVNQQSLRPSGVIWVQFDHVDVGMKTRHENRQLYANGSIVHRLQSNQSLHSLQLVETELFKL